MTRAIIAAALVFALGASAAAHRLNEYLQAATIDIAGSTIVVRMRLTPGADVATRVAANVDADQDGAFSVAEQRDYGERVRRDLSLSVDGQPVSLHLTSSTFSSRADVIAGRGDIVLTFAAEVAGAAAPHELTLENRHERDVAAYLVNALLPTDAAVHILQQQRNVDQSRYVMRYALGAATGVHDSTVSPIDGAVVRTYAWHGLWHILGGYDHLLFLGALVLAAATLWDLVKVVTAFTIAHSFTLTLAALNWVHLPSRIVEPLIAASIIAVALQNVVWPEQAQGRGRLVVVFLFGLFHGLGFASGLLDVMHQLPTSTVLLAVLGFSIGVEAGNQAVMLPLFAVLRLANRPASSAHARPVLAATLRRVGSTGVSIAGAYYLLAALTQG